MVGPTRVSYGRVFDAPVESAFDVVLPLELPTLFSRRHLAIPPIREVGEQQGAWASPGQQRRIVLADGGTMLETLVEVDRPRRFTYELTEITGALSPLVERVEGAWEFAPAGTGVRVGWTWDLHPRGVAGRVGLPVLAAMWRGYAAKNFDHIGAALRG